jgi:hypothetical protein
VQGVCHQLQSQTTSEQWISSGALSLRLQNMHSCSSRNCQ